MIPSPFSDGRRRRGSALVTAAIFTMALTTMLAGVAMYIGNSLRLQQRAEALAQARYTAESAVNEAFDDVVTSFGTFVAAQGLAIDIPRTYFATRALPPMDPNVIGWMPTNRKLDARTAAGSVMAGGRLNWYGIDGIQVMPGVLTTANTLRFAATGAAAPGNPQLSGRLVITQSLPIIAGTIVRTENGSRIASYTYRDMAVQLVPMFGDTVWYLPNLEIANGPPLSLSGTLYSGGDLYLSGGGGELTISSTTYAVQDVFYGRHPIRVANGHSSSLAKVRVYNSQTGASTEWPSTLNLSSNYTASNPSAGSNPQSDWRTQFAANFGNGVLGNMPPMNLPGTPPGLNGTNYRDSGQNGSRFLIEPGQSLPATTDSSYTQRLQQEAQKMYHRANLRIVYDVARGTGGAISGTPTVRAYKAATRSSQGLVTAWSEVALPSGVASFNASYKGGTVTTNNASLYDARRAQSGYTGSANGGHILTLDIDVAKLRNAVEVISGTTERFPAGTATFNPVTDWNGVVYVEAARTNAGTGVRLLNGSRLPNRNAANPVGMTVATNDVLYVQGHYNADGNNSTGGPETADHMNSNGTTITGSTRAEWPAALVADAVNLLSPSFSRTGTSVPTAGNFLEVSAAILAGIVPSKSTAYSGGLENFPRFLESWGSSREVRYRGSMVCLFDSTVANEAWGASSVYDAPKRVWGFNRMFGNGELPPATPMAVVENGIPPSNFRSFGPTQYVTEYNRILAEITAATGEQASVVETRFAPYNADGTRRASGPLMLR